MRILESSEDYLEAMLMMKEKHGYIRSIDIAMELGVTKPSVSYATKRLRENGYITMDREGLITLTDKGREIAERIYDRHKRLTEFLMYLGVDEETAKEALTEILPVLEGISDWTVDSIHAAVFARIGELGVKNGWMLWPLRTALSGKPFTPGGGIELCAILGKDETLKRVQDGINRLS